MSSGYGFNLYTQSPYVQTGETCPTRLSAHHNFASQATIDYVKTDNGSVAYSYTINPNNSTGTNYTITATTGPTWHQSSGAVGVTAGSGQNFTITRTAYGWLMCWWMASLKEQ